METKQTTSVLEETRIYQHGIGLRGELTLESVIRYRGVCDQFIRVMDIINDWLETRDYVRNHPIQ